MDNIFVLRHGVAEDYSLVGDDFNRKLTDDGIKKTKRLSQFFNGLKEDLDIVLTSPYVRAKETAELFIENIAPKPKLEVADFMSVGASSREIAQGLLPYNNYKKVVVVGHEPDLGLFIGDVIDADGIRVKKGALAKINLFNSIELSGELEWMITSKVIKAIKG